MEEKKSQISLNDAMDHYEGVSHVKCLWSSKIIRIDGLVWSVPESNEVWLKEGGHLKVLLVKGNTYAEIIGGKKKSRDLLSEVKEYFPLNAKVHCIATDVSFFVTDKSNFYLLDDHTVHYALGGQSYKFPKRTSAVVYECSKFAHFYNVFPEGECIGKEINMLKEAKEARKNEDQGRRLVYMHEEDLSPNHMHPNDLIRFDLPKAAQLMADPEGRRQRPDPKSQPHMKQFDIGEAIKNQTKTPVIRTDMELNENDIQDFLTEILDRYPDPKQQNAFWLLIRDRLIGIRTTEMQELNENVNKEMERIQLLKDSLEDLT